jgi:hypothetical protein
MPGAPYYAEAFPPLPGRCFPMVGHHAEAGHREAGAGRLARVVAGAEWGAATGSRPARATGLHRSWTAA